jgi:hypothetical protein
MESAAIAFDVDETLISTAEPVSGGVRIGSQHPGQRVTSVATW